MLEKPGAVAYLMALSRHAKQLHAVLDPIYYSTLQQYANIGAEPGTVSPEADGLSERGGGLLESMTNQMSQPPPSPFVRPPPSPPLGSINVRYPPSPTPVTFAEPQPVVEGPSLSGRPGDWWPTERPTSFDVPPAWESYYSRVGVVNQAGNQPASGPFSNFGAFLQMREGSGAAAATEAPEAPPRGNKPRSAFERRRGWLYVSEPLRADAHPSCEPCRRRAAGCAAASEGGAASPDGCAAGAAVGCGSVAATRAECRWESAAAARRACDSWPACGGFVCVAGGASEAAAAAAAAYSSAASASAASAAAGGVGGAECAARAAGGAWRLSLSTTPPTSYRKHPRPVAAQAAVALRATTPPAEARGQPDGTAALGDDGGPALSAAEGAAALQPLLVALFGDGGGDGDGAGPGDGASRPGATGVAGSRPLNASFELRQAQRAVRRAAARVEQRQRRADFRSKAAAAATAGSAAALLAPGADYYLGNKRVVVPSQSGEDACYGMACQQAGVAGGHNDPTNPGSSDYDGLVPIANNNYNWEGPMLEMKDVSRVLDGNAWLAKQIESMYAGG